MLLLITQRLAARLPTTSLSLARASFLLPSTLQIQPQTRLNRRTFLTGSSRLAFPAAAKKATAAASAKKKSSTTTSGAKKESAKKPAAKKIAAKAKAKPKRKVAAKKKPVAKKKPKAKKPVKPTRPKLTAADFPPRYPKSAYIFFYTNYVKSLPSESKPKSIADIVQCSRTAGHQWGAMTDEEKEPYKELERKGKAAFQIERDAYWKVADPKTVAEINRRRRARGKKGIKKITMPENKRPLSSFLRYMADFRSSPAAQTIRDSLTPGPDTLRVLAKTAGLNWRGMSETEKAKYTEAAAKEREAWNIKHPKA